MYDEVAFYFYPPHYYYLVVAAILLLTLAPSALAQKDYSFASGTAPQPQATGLSTPPASKPSTGKNQSSPEVAPHIPNVPNCRFFSDVLIDNYSCYSINQLAERGAVSGYPNGTFGPNNSVLRGEFTKILVKGFGWAINNGGGPHFRDVPPGDTFYDTVETVYNNGAINGYNEGTNECPDNKISDDPPRCFRKNDPIRRGEVAKIVATAAGFTDDTSGRAASYSDLGSTVFATFIERLVIHGVTAPAIATCSAGPPCFSPNANSPRRDVVVLVQSAFERFSVFEQRAIVYGIRGGLEQGTVFANRYIQVGAYLTLDANDVVRDVYGLVSAGDPWNHRYIQVGYKRSSAGSSTRLRFARYQNGLNPPVDVVGTGVQLGVNYPYRVYVVSSGGNNWQAVFCYTSCDTLTTADLIVAELPFAYAGGEGADLRTIFAEQRISSAFAQNVDSSVYNWCPDTILPPLRTGTGNTAGVISACSNNSWTVKAGR